MANVRELFPTLEKLQRTKRGARARKVWTKAPSLEQVAAKIAPIILDTHVKKSVVNGAPVEMRRYIVRSGNKFGYLCLKPGEVRFETCRNYDEFQALFNQMAERVRWYNNYAQLLEHLTGHCTSPSYVERAKKVKV